MKKKYSKILGVALTVALVSSLFAFALPVSAAEGNMQWAAQPTPGVTSNVLVNGSDVTDFAVAADGKTIYAITGANMNTGATPWALYKSVDGGQSFSPINLSTVTGTSANPLGCIAIAPDSADTAAFSVRITGAIDTVFITSTGGISWAQLPAFAAPAGANTDVMDLAVGPARAGTIFGRDYMAALADTTAGFVAADVQTIGGGAAWATIEATNVAGIYDYMACQFSPSFVGDRTVAVVGADNITGATGVHLQLVDTRTTAQITNVVLDAVVDDLGQGGTGILAADIAVPIDWDPSVPSGRRTWVSTASATIANDSVYRVDNTTCWDLGVGVTNLAWESVAYSGTIEAGTLFAGAYAIIAGTINTNVVYALDPQVLQPLWKSTQRPPTGNGGQAVVRVDPNFAETQTVFVGTGGGGAETAFGASYNAGVSFVEESLIDTGFTTVVDIDDVKLTPDGSTLFMATNDATELSLWRTSTPPSFTSWARVYCVTATGPGLLAVNPGYAETPAVFFADTSVGGRIYTSQNGGDTYSARWAPVVTLGLGALAMEDNKIVYAGQGNNVYKSTNACWIWGAPKAALVGNITTLDASAPGLLLIGGTNEVAYSLDGAATSTLITGGIAAAGICQVLPDEGYADNNIIYCAGATSGLVYRFEIGVSAGWDNLINPTTAGAIYALGMNNGAFYAMSDNATDRTLGPLDAPGTITWRTMDVPAATVINSNIGTAAGNRVYEAQGASVNLWAYNDYLATTTPAVSAPAMVSVDPVTGRANIVELSWPAMGTGTGLVNAVDVLIWPKAKSIAAASADFGNGIILPTAPSVSIVRTVDAGVNDVGYDLIAGTEYNLWLRANNMVSGDAVVSPWYKTVSFKVEAGVPVQAPYAGPMLQAPVPGGQGVSLRPGFSWAPITNAVKYEFELSKDAGTTARGYFVDALVGLTGDNALAAAGWQCDVDLEYDTSYFWHVKAITADGGETVWGTAQFTTIAEAAVPVPPAPPVELPAPITPAWIWAIVAIGAVLVIVVIVLIFVTRKP